MSRNTGALKLSTSSPLAQRNLVEQAVAHPRHTGLNETTIHIQNKRRFCAPLAPERYAVLLAKAANAVGLRLACSGFLSRACLSTR